MYFGNPLDTSSGQSIHIPHKELKQTIVMVSLDGWQKNHLTVSFPKWKIISGANHEGEPSPEIY